MRILDYACDAAMDQGSEEPLNVWAAIEVGGCRALAQGLPEPPAAFRNLKHTCLMCAGCRSERNVRMLQAAIPGALCLSHWRVQSGWMHHHGCYCSPGCCPRRLVSGGTEAARASARSTAKLLRYKFSSSLRGMPRAR